MPTPEIQLASVSNLFSRMMHFKNAGDMEYGHTHQFDHLTLLARGRLKVTVNGVQTEFIAPHMIYIKKDKLHELVALEDDTLAFCIHALRLGDGVNDIIDPDMIPDGVEPEHYVLLREWDTCDVSHVPPPTESSGNVPVTRY